MVHRCFVPIMFKSIQNGNYNSFCPIANSSGKVQRKKMAHTLSRSNLLHFIAEHGFGLFLASGWSVLLGIATGYLSYLLFTNKDYDEYSIKEALENLATGKEVSK